MGKLLPVPYPGQSMEEYKQVLIDFKKNYWSFLKPSKSYRSGGRLIPTPPPHLKPKQK